MIRIKKGLDLPITGKPVNKAIINGKAVKAVAITGFDYNGLKPSMLVKVGDEVKAGQPVFGCKKTEGVTYTAPAGGKIVAINRGERRVFQSLTIEIGSNEGFVEFKKYDSSQLGSISADEAKEQMLKSGMWTAFKTRPFSKVPAANTKPHSIFVTAMDSAPLAAKASTIIGDGKDFANGVEVLAHLTDGDVHVCHRAGSRYSFTNSKIKTHGFDGKHPAGNAGTHIHFIDPVNEHKTVWSIGFQDVMAIGRLFTTGKLSTERVISFGGPGAKSPELLRTRLGAKISELIEGLVNTDLENRIISGSVLYGRQADNGAFDFVGQFHNQITALPEGRHRDFIGWMMPGFTKYTASKAFVSAAMIGKFKFTTNKNGSPRAMVPIGLYEKVMPLDILPTQLLRAIITKDSDSAIELGALELDEEDLALCTFVDQGKVDYGPALRDLLTTIELEG